MAACPRFSYHLTKPEASEYSTRCHPSTSTNRSILNGAEIITGGNMNIPIDVNTLDTTISITRNGR